MQKTKLGLSVGVCGAVIYFTAILGGFIPLVIMAGYVFLKEENIWLRKAAFKAIALALVFSGLTTAVNCIDDVLGIFNSLFDLSLRLPLNLDYVLKEIINLAEIVIFAILGFKAFGQGDLSIPTIDAAMDENK